MHRSMISSRSSNTSLSRYESPVVTAAENQPIAEPVSVASSSRVAAYIRLARPKQWIKNVLVIAAPAAAGVLGDSTALFRTGIAFICFCLAASGTYYINDALDVEADRRHPTKRNRPVAAGLISVRAAIAGGVVLIAASIGLSFVTRWPLAL